MSVDLFFTYNLLALMLGYIFDIMFGDPRWTLHPVKLIGHIILLGERFLYKNRFINGLFLMIFTVGVVAGSYVGMLIVAWRFSNLWYIVVSAIGVWCGISVKSMRKEVTKVITALEANNIDMARQMIALLVSRDTKNMAEQKIISSAIETVSENFTDAVLAPIFFSMLGGGAGAIFFKCISTLDSMVGYRNSRYGRFGTASAKMDDILSFIPARLSIIPIMMASVFVRGNIIDAWQCFYKQRNDHASPNSAHAISAFAGALEITLGGPTFYGGIEYNKPYICGGDMPLVVGKINQALDLYEKAAFCAVITIALAFYSIF